MVTCSFCGYEIVPTTGKKYFKKDGKALSFCSHKCETNMIKLKRIPRKTKWTKEARDLKIAQKKLAEKAKSEKKSEKASA